MLEAPSCGRWIGSPPLPGAWLDWVSVVVLRVFVKVFFCEGCACVFLGCACFLLLFVVHVFPRLVYRGTQGATQTVTYPAKRERSLFYQGDMDNWVAAGRVAVVSSPVSNW